MILSFLPCSMMFEFSNFLLLTQCFACLGASFLAAEHEFAIRRPENGIGHLQVSTLTQSSNLHNDNYYNDHRLVMFFDTDCLTRSHMKATRRKKSPFLNEKQLESLQHEKINSIISNHYPCLSHTQDTNGDIHHFIMPSLKTGISFVDMNQLHNGIDTINQKCGSMLYGF